MTVSVAATAWMLPVAHENAPGQKPPDDRGAAGRPASRVDVSADQIVAQDISVVTLETGTIDRRVTVPGTITADAARVVRVPARVSGIVAEMRKLLGSEVKAGEVVSVLDSREVADAKSEFLAARVQAELQRNILERQQKLLQIKAIAAGQLDQTRASFQEADLRTDLARQKLAALGLDVAEVEAAARRDDGTLSHSNLRRYALRSPIAGRVVERKVDVGTSVGKEGEPADVYTIADLSTLWVELAVPVSELHAIKEGTRVIVTGGAADPRHGEARVIFISPLLDTDTRTARVVATLPNPDLEWRPGAFVSAEIILQSGRPSLLVPRAAVQRLDGEPKVFVRVAGGFEARPIRLGPGDDRFFEVMSGVAKGDQVAVANSFLLKAELGKADTDGD